MAFNFGAFAGGVAKAGLQTYQMLSEEEERELIKEERRRKLQQERDIQNAAKVYDQVGTSDTVGNAVQTSAESQGALPTGSSTPAPTSLRAALSENQGALPTGAQSTRPVLTQEQADKEFARRLSAIDPRLGRQARIETAQIRELERKETNQNKFNSAMDNLDKDLATIQSTVESKGMQGVYELAKKNGLNVKYIEPKNEGSLATVQLIGKDGKVERIFTSASDAAEALSEVRMNRFVERDALPLLGDAKSIMDAMNARRTANREDRRVGLEERRVVTEETLVPQRIEQMKAQIRESLATATGKELDAAEKREYNNLRTELLGLLEKPTAENAGRIQQLARRAAILNPKEVLVTKTERNPDTGILESITTNVLTGEVQKSLSESNVPSAAVMAAAKSGKNPKTGQPYNQADIDAWNQKYPGTPWPGPQTSGKSAIPAR